MTTYPVKNISISINKPKREVYQFVSNPLNFPKWVAFIKAVKKQDRIWLAQTDLGELKMEFVPKNSFGIIDHLVSQANGTTVNNPLRVVSNGNGSELIFTLFWMPERTEVDFKQDAKAVESDLETVKRILESN